MKRTLIWSIAILILILLRLYFTSNHQFVGTYQNVTFANQKIVINSDGTYFLFNSNQKETLEWDNELSFFKTSDNDICLHHYHSPNQNRKSFLMLSKLEKKLKVINWHIQESP
jgi:hypothetical protein